MVKVLLYDNNLLLSAAFQSLLKNQEGITGVNTATTQNLLKILKNSDVDLLLISLALLGNGKFYLGKKQSQKY